MLNQTFLKAAGGLADAPCPWRINRPSDELVVDSFQLYFCHGQKKALISRTVFETKNEMRVHIRLQSTCTVFRVRGVIVRMPYLPSRKVRWANSIWCWALRISRTQRWSYSSHKNKTNAQQLPTKLDKSSHTTPAHLKRRNHPEEQHSHSTYPAWTTSSTPTLSTF